MQDLVKFSTAEKLLCNSNCYVLYIQHLHNCEPNKRTMQKRGSLLKGKIKGAAKKIKTV